MIAWLALGSALAAPLDAAAICGAKERVVLSPDVQSRFQPTGACPSVVPAQTVADYLKAFALRSRELAEPDNADRLVQRVEARWLWVKTIDGYAVYDAEAKGFVPPATFAEATAPEPLTEAQKAAREAYLEGYKALRAKRYDEARAKLTDCIGSDPDHAGCHWELGWVHWVAEDWTAAAGAWTEVERIEPAYPELEVWLRQARNKASAAKPTPESPE